MLHRRERGLDEGQVAVQHAHHLIELAGQIAGLVQHLDQMNPDHALDRVADIHLQLFEQVPAQGHRFRDPLIDGPFVGLESPAAVLSGPLGARAARPGVARAAVVEVFEVGIERRLGVRRQALGPGQIERIGWLHGGLARGRVGLGLTGGGVGLRAVALFALGPLVAFEQRIALKFPLHIGRKFHAGKLQQLDRLLQLRRHDQGLTLAKL